MIIEIPHTSISTSTFSLHLHHHYDTTLYPSVLIHDISPSQYQHTIEHINSILENAINPLIYILLLHPIGICTGAIILLLLLNIGTIIAGIIMIVVSVTLLYAIL